MRKRSILKSNEQIVGMSVPNDQLKDWYDNVIKDGGFTEEEKDFLLSKLNSNYKEQYIQKLLDKLVAKINDENFKKYGTELSIEQQRQFRIKVKNSIEKELGLAK